MKDLNWPELLTRLYYVGWAVIAVICIAEGLDKFHSIPLESITAMVSGLVGPWFFLKLIKWLIAGSKKEKTS